MCLARAASTFYEHRMTGATSYFQLNNVSDSADEEIVSGTISMVSSDLELGRGDGAKHLVAIRFPSVDVPAAARVKLAILTFEVSDVNNQSSAPLNLIIFGETSTNSTPITTEAFDLSSRAPTNAAVLWSPGLVTDVNNALHTNDISPVVQEIVSLCGWISGSPLTILLAHVSGTGSRWVERQSKNSPGMEITYTIARANDADELANWMPDMCNQHPEVELNDLIWEVPQGYA
jgi:hypothetical protein